MVVNETIAREKKNNAVDMLVTLIVDELATDFQMDSDVIFSKFVSSRTGELLYDEESDLWWSGPSDIAELFKAEIGKGVD